MKERDYIYSIGNEKILIETAQKGIREEVIQQFKDCRKSKRVTQEELARMTGISQPNVTRFESGSYNPSLAMMVKMAEALGMELKVALIDRKQ